MDNFISFGSKTRFVATALIMSLWSMSIHGAYQFGHSSAEFKALKNFHAEMAQNIATYQQIASDYLSAKENRIQRLTTLQGQINDYLASHSDYCRLQPDSVRLLNTLINQPRERDSAAARDAYPLRTAANP